ncbi:MAG: TraB/GumN family protein [Bacteroidia bacterium]
MKLLRILLGLLFISSHYCSAQQDVLLWKVTGNNLEKPSYLFGTYHLLSGDFIKQVKGASKALNKSEAVVGELEIDESAAAKLMNFMVMTDNSLDSLLSPEQYDTLSIALKERMGVPAMMMNKLKPMGVYIMLASAETAKDNSVDLKNKGQLMDAWVQEEAKKKEKQVFSLETAEEQAEVLFNSSLDRQKDMLMEYLRLDREEARKENDRIVDCYKNQNLDCLVEIMESSNYTQIEKDVMLKDRNVKWIPQLKEFMGSKSCFVAVGALHLPGKDGLITLLRDQGFTVEAVRSKKDL